MGIQIQKRLLGRLFVCACCIGSSSKLLCEHTKQNTELNGQVIVSMQTDCNYAQYAEQLSTWYKEKTRRILNLKNPITFSEKIQWLKLYDSTPMKTILADKYLVKEWVKEKIGQEYVVPLFGVWDSFDDIDFSKLPKQFVLKVNHGSKTNIFVLDKFLIDKAKMRETINKWLTTNYAFRYGFEMHYAGIRPRIIAEQFIEGDGNGYDELCEYSVFCFNGNPHFIVTNMVVQGKNTDRHNVYDRYWNFQPFTLGFQNPPEREERPVFLDELIRLSTILCKDFKFVRVDFFYAKNKIYFGEMTFTPRSGVGKIRPEKYERILGDMLLL